MSLNIFDALYNAMPTRPRPMIMCENSLPNYKKENCHLIIMAMRKVIVVKVTMVKVITESTKHKKTMIIC